MLEASDICIAYGGHQVVHDVSLAVAPGEVISLIGPSGAGKSSFLRSINWLEPPCSGTLTFDGSTFRGLRDGGVSKRQLQGLRRSIGMVFQQFNLFPHLSALENVVLAQVHALGRSKAEARERALQELHHVGLGEVTDKLPSKCSGGQQQRIAIARALALDPQVMLFDEPTSALDPEYAMDVLVTMRRLADEGMTMLVVTHEMHFAAEVADRVVFMAEGRVVEEGPAAALIRDPQHERTQKFLAAVKGR
ncbi:amino acid ABC transporter ATP-binding protein [Nocardioides zeae]|uniref:Amino acid ABC transporter ATP-binding protein n=1 Tax=Nocardioides zeae TaxID=1457234 RepID=A0A6P0HRL9_9ACTN|nr:amino acid ABC transporter ATP-binding protein [Nocardioides zeae]NEN80644.1 amino acid ABC transporter ATP-binding protein [Nocardioides zeae]